jgi:hypothetical protein
MLSVWKRSERQKAWRQLHQKRLPDQGSIEKLRTEADYLERNAERMRRTPSPGASHHALPLFRGTG